MRPGDIVLLHDPQTAGPARGLQDRDVHVIWRKVRGIEYAPPWVPDRSLQVISPSIDPFAFKNCDLDGGSVDRVLGLTGLIAGDISQPLAFKGRDGSSQVVRRHTDLLWGTEPDRARACGCCGDNAGESLGRIDGYGGGDGRVMVAFAEHIAPRIPNAHLLLVGPAFQGIADDPESAEVFAGCVHRGADWQTG